MSSLPPRPATLQLVESSKNNFLKKNFFLGVALFWTWHFFSRVTKKYFFEKKEDFFFGRGTFLMTSSSRTDRQKFKNFICLSDPPLRYQKVMCSKMFVKIVENNFFKDFSTNRKERYWSIVLN